MERSLITLLLFTGVISLVLSVPRKYYLIQKGKTWGEAQAYCRAEHTDLAIIRSNDDMVRLQNEALRQQFSSSAWIGLYRVSWRWSLGNEPLGSMTQWAGSEPDTSGGQEACGAIDPWGWLDAPCTLSLSFVCFDDRITALDSYIKISDPKTWHEAQSYCRQHYTDLASARDATENAVIQAMATQWTWFGLFRDAWKWSDQTRFSTVSWLSVTNLGNENCVHISTGQAADARCSAKKPFFCYSVITGRKHIISVKVQSNQDMNHSAVKMAILEQIKQKLKDHGMAENITVKWREQPDGVVFHKEKENTVEN